MFDILETRANATENVRLHLAFEDFAFSIVNDGARIYAAVENGKLRLSETPPPRPVDFEMAASAAAWAEILGDEPKPGFQTLNAMRRTQHLIVAGDMIAYSRRLFLLELLFSNLSRGAEASTAPSPATAEIDPIVGRYIRFQCEGRPHRIYFEEAGEGIPILCLHTAGSDGRQFRHILNDPEITKRFRVIAFDLPWHGKSSPPPGYEADVYKLTTDGYMAIVLAMVEALGLEKPVVMGCSIGGRAVLHLALRHGALFRAAIGLQSALYAERLSLGDPDPDMSLHRPDIHGSKLAGANMAGMIAPQSPAAERWETMWHYMQGGPGIFHGDLNYYFADGDLRNGQADGLRASPCPLYLLNGEYDPSATPEMGREVAELAGAAHFEVMRGMGHFPMSENPALFRDYLLPVLAKIEAL